jgi:hypothetical protein
MRKGKVELKPIDIAKIQYIIGDDETRSYLAVLRIERGIAHWNKMFDKIIWKREDDFQLKRCEEILSKDRLTDDERNYVINYLRELFNSMKELKEKIKEIGEQSF